MLRIFGHFVPVPALALGLSEAFLLATAFYLVNAPAAAWHLPLAAFPAQVSLGGASIVVLAMVAVGLYHHDVFLDPRLMAIKAAAALLLIVAARRRCRPRAVARGARGRARRLVDVVPQGELRVAGVGAADAHAVLALRR